jgi:hypothetical protein
MAGYGAKGGLGEAMMQFGRGIGADTRQSRQIQAQAEAQRLRDEADLLRQRTLLDLRNRYKQEELDAAPGRAYDKTAAELQAQQDAYANADIPWPGTGKGQQQQKPVMPYEFITDDEGNIVPANKMTGQVGGEGARGESDENKRLRIRGELEEVAHAMARKRKFDSSDFPTGNRKTWVAGTLARIMRGEMTIDRAIQELLDFQKGDQGKGGGILSPEGASAAPAAAPQQGTGSGQFFDTADVLPVPAQESSNLQPLAPPQGGFPPAPKTDARGNPVDPNKWRIGVERLRKNPHTAQQFEAVFGPGTAAGVLQR